MRKLLSASFFMLALQCQSYCFATPCRVDPPVLTVKGQDFYSDKSASIPDADREAEDRALYRPIQIFVLHLAQIVDSEAAASDELDCVSASLDSWAKAQSMLGKPSNFEAERERARFTIGLNIIALKMSGRGKPVSGEVKSWLRSLSQESVRYFDSRNKQNGWSDNLYVWSGVDAASSLAIWPDEKMSNYVNQVWSISLSKIDFDGTIKSELARGGRSMLYHQYYLSGLLLLRSFRQFVDLQISNADDRRIESLADYVTKGICQISMSKVSSSGDTPENISQELPPPYQFAVPAAFGRNFLNRRWYQCAKPPTPLIDSGFGGDMGELAKLLGSKVSTRSH